MKKIAFIVPIFKPARLRGDGVAISQIIELLKENHDITVITSKALNYKYWINPFTKERINQEYEEIDKIKIIRLKCNQIYTIFLYFLNIISKFKFIRTILPKNLCNLSQTFLGPIFISISEVLKEKKFDHVHLCPAPYLFTIQIWKFLKEELPNTKISITPFFHSENPHYYSDLYKDLYKKVDLIHVVSEYEKKLLIDQMGVNSAKIKTIPLFLDSSVIKISQIDIEEFIEKHSLKDKTIVLFAGLKHKLKGFDILLDAFSRLHQTNKEVILLTIGEPKFLEYKFFKKEYLNFVKDLGFVNEKDKKIAFQVADIFCLPSIYESFGLVYLEAWENSLPVIAADIPAVKELVDNCGIIINRNNPEDLHMKLEKLIYSPKLRIKLGREGKNRLDQNFSKNSLKIKYVEFFK